MSYMCNKGEVVNGLSITNCQTSTYVDQVMDILNHEETICLLDLYNVLCRAEQTAMETVVQAESKEVTTLNPTLEFSAACTVCSVGILWDVIPEISYSLGAVHGFVDEGLYRASYVRVFAFQSKVSIGLFLSVSI